MIIALTEECKIYGDFFGTGELANVEEQLVGCHYRHEELRETMRHINLQEYFGDISLEEFLSLF